MFRPFADWLSTTALSKTMQDQAWVVPTSQSIHITGPVIDAPAVAALLDKNEIAPIQKHAALRGIADKIVVYEIP